MAPLPSALLAASAAAAVFTPAWAQPPELLSLSGACDAKLELTGLTYHLQGYTLAGAPYWKAFHKEEYIFWDPDCDGSGDGTPRWIVDDNMPSLTAHGDLDGDGGCSYHARTNSEDKTRPPTAAWWNMECSGVKADYFITLLEVTTTTGEPTTTTTSSLSTTKTEMTTRTSYQAPSTTKTQTDHSATEDPAHNGVGLPGASEEQFSSAPKMFALSGACAYKANLNGLTYELTGHTADGAPYYKAHNVEEYMYHDVNCDGSGLTVARWILDSDRPSSVRNVDLDGDGKCDYHARLDSAQGSGFSATKPPVTASWRMYCGELQGWRDVTLVLRVVSEVQTTASPSKGSDMMVSGAPAARYRGLAALGLALPAVLLRAVV